MKMQLVVVAVATLGLGIVYATTSPNDETSLEIERRALDDHYGVKRAPSEVAEPDVGKKEKVRRQMDEGRYYKFPPHESEEEHANKRDVGEEEQVKGQKAKRQMDEGRYYKFPPHESEEEHANKRDVGEKEKVKRQKDGYQYWQFHSHESEEEHEHANKRNIGEKEIDAVE